MKTNATIDALDRLADKLDNAAESAYTPNAVRHHLQRASRLVHQSCGTLSHEIRKADIAGAERMRQAVLDRLDTLRAERVAHSKEARALSEAWALISAEGFGR